MYLPKSEKNKMGDQFKKNKLPSEFQKLQQEIFPTKQPPYLPHEAAVVCSLPISSQTYLKLYGTKWLVFNVNIVLSVPTCNTLCNNPATTAGQQHK
jgi:hypothetical protein